MFVAFKIIRIQVGTIRTIRVDHNNFLQVAIKTHSFIEFVPGRTMIFLDSCTEQQHATRANKREIKNEGKRSKKLLCNFLLRRGLVGSVRDTGDASATRYANGKQTSLGTGSTGHDWLTTVQA